MTDMNETAAVLDRVLALGITHELKARGFRKSGRTFRRVTAASLQVVHVQMSKGAVSDRIRFTINLGAYFPEFAAAIHQRLMTSAPAVSACHLERRLGMLMPVRQDLWWEVAKDSDVGTVAGETASALREFGLPWLDALSEYTSTGSVLQGHAFGGLAVVVLVHAGRMDEASVALGQVLKDPDVPRALATWAQDRGVRPRL